MFNAKIDDRIVAITFVATVLLRKLSKNVLNTLKFKILVYKDLMSRDAQFESSGIVSFVYTHTYIYIYIYIYVIIHI